MSYESEILNEKKYKGNVVIQIGSDYFSIRQPDSGLSIPSPFDKSVMSLLLNPTQIDIEKVTTTISSFSFKILDKEEIVTALILGDAAPLNNEAVRIFLGRSGVNMPFSDYYELPTTYVKKLDRSDNGYNFTCTEQTERMTKPIYKIKSALGAALLIDTTTWTMRDDISTFPTSGFLKVDNEVVSYSGVDLVNNRFTGVIRGELNTVPAAHNLYTEVYFLETVTDNPLNIILQILISNGGAGTYDVLEDGLGISNTLIDIAGIEALRDELFEGREFTLSLVNIDSALKEIENELLLPNSLRFTTNGAKITLAVLDRARFVEFDDVIDEDTITKFPKWSLDGNKVTNSIEVNWEYDIGTNMYQERNLFEDAASIASYGLQSLVYNFKGPRSALDGDAIVEDFGQRLLARLSLPTPEISISTQMDKSLQTIGDRAYLISNKIPAADGTLNFASDLEIISRSINHTNGDVQFKLAFTSYTNIRSGFIAPSDSITVKTSQKILEIGSGRGGYYLAGWKMRLWNTVTRLYESDPVNAIDSIDGDEITFLNNWATTVVVGTHKIRFADYDDVAETQKRYCFISDNGANFTVDDKPTYKVTY